MFGTVEGAWLQSMLATGAPVPSNPAEKTLFYATLPLYLLEVRLNSAEIAEIGDFDRHYLDTALERLEGIWVRIDLDGTLPADLYDNLFVAPTSVGVSRIARAERHEEQLLDSFDPLADVPDATEQKIRDTLDPVSVVEEIVVYDVGQGAANGLVSEQEVQCYFDFGGGAAGNTATFPPKFRAFCQCNKPPIILSHWDHDHWSSEGRDTRVHAHTWIVPRQHSSSSKRAPHHSALISAIQKLGTILVWPSGAAIRIGQLEISQCTGRLRNDSGLALEVHPHSTTLGERPVLMPADAGYDDLQKAPSNGDFDAIVCPHHGGRSNSPMVPRPPSARYQRLIYSYGPYNTYSHPLPATYNAHHGMDWFDNRKGITSPMPPPHIVRNTETRTTSGLGHVGFDWTASTALSKLACSGTSTLDVQQK